MGIWKMKEEETNFFIEKVLRNVLSLYLMIGANFALKLVGQRYISEPF
jgi:hypothetical protein